MSAENTPSDHVWASDGDVGDTLYSMAAVKQRGGGHLVLYRASVREPYSAEKGERLRPLLARQPYLRSVRYSDRCEGEDIARWRRHYKGHLNIADMISEVLGVPHYPRDEPWLFCDQPLHIADVVVHRSPRYHGPMRWHRLIEEYLPRAVFVGMPEEHQAWCAEFGKIPYYPTANWWELARVISGAMLFIGNQSAPMALALGLCRTFIWQEQCPSIPNCHFGRNGVYYGDTEPPAREILPAAGRSLLTPDRLHNLARYAKQVRTLPGAAAVCGCYRGGDAALVAFHCPERIVRVFDAGGLPYDETDCHHRKGEFGWEHGDLGRFLARYDNIDFRPGLFPATTEGLPADERYAFVYLDFDLYRSTLDALRYFLPRMVQGGVIVLDDLHWGPTPGVDRALREEGLMPRVQDTAPMQGVLVCD